MSKVHKCGTVVADERICPGCGRPLIHLPDEIRALTLDVERWTGLDRHRISLLGVITSAYMSGWDDALVAVDERQADEIGP